MDVTYGTIRPYRNMCDPLYKNITYPVIFYKGVGYIVSQWYSDKLNEETIDAILNECEKAVREIGIDAFIKYHCVHKDTQECTKWLTLYEKYVIILLEQT